MTEASDSSYALITGPTSGIGRELARIMAGHGHDLVLVARDEARLTELARELRERFCVRVTTIAVDLAQEDAVERIAAALREAGIKVGVLVNNAGFGIHAPFETSDLGKELAMIQVQLSAMLGLTKLALPMMQALGRGRILNVGSLYCFSPVAYQAVYGACKAFMLSFSDALRSELRGRDITVTTLCPGATRTEFRERAGVRARHESSGMDPVEVAAQGYRGMVLGRRLVVPGLWNKVFVLVTRLLPVDTVAGLLRLINDIRGVNRR